MRPFINIVETSLSIVPVLYHGTCPSNADVLIENGWAPNLIAQGANMGQTRYLYLTTHPEDALWFAEQKGCSSIVEVRDVPIASLRVDPEDGIADTVEDEISNGFGLPGKLVLTKPLGADHFFLYR